MSIYPEKNRHGGLTGSFRIEVQKGARRLRGRADTYREAQSIEARLKAKLDLPATHPVRPGPVSAKSSITLAEAVDRSRGKLWHGNSDERAARRKLRRIADIIGPSLPIDAVDTNSIDTLIAELEGDELSDATINRYLSAVSAFLKFCSDRNIRTSPLPKIEWRNEASKRIRWLSYTEEDQMVRILPAPFRDIVWCAIRTGMRASEILTLKADQVQPGWVHLWKTKNDEPRSVPINAEIYRRLGRLVREGMPDYWKLRYEWDKAREAMGLSDDRFFVFHACRHTYATRAIMANVNIRVLQKLMGHKTINTTLRYAHVDDKTLADAAHSALDFHDLRGNRRRGITPKTPLLHRGERLPTKEARWRSGYAEDCKSLHAGSIPARLAFKTNDIANDD